MKNLSSVCMSHIRKLTTLGGLFIECWTPVSRVFNLSIVVFCTGYPFFANALLLHFLHNQNFPLPPKRPPPPNSHLSLSKWPPRPKSTVLPSKRPPLSKFPLPPQNGLLYLYWKQCPCWMARGNCLWDSVPAWIYGSCGKIFWRNQYISNKESTVELPIIYGHVGVYFVGKLSRNIDIVISPIASASSSHLMRWEITLSTHNIFQIDILILLT